MRLYLQLVATLLISTPILLANPAWSHDFWLQPNRFKVAPGVADAMTIEVGHAQFRARWSGNLERVVEFSSVGPQGRSDLRADLKPDSERDAFLSFPTASTQVLVFHSNHATSVLPSIRFNDYLKAEGLTPALQIRAQTGKMDAPGREIYSRCAKAIVQIGTPGPKPEPYITAPVGLPLEIVPQRNPYTLKAGERLPVQVLYQGHPLAGATVMLTNLEFDGQALETQISDHSGQASFIVPHVGTWLVNVLWTQPIQGNPDARLRHDVLKPDVWILRALSDHVQAAYELMFPSASLGSAAAFVGFSLDSTGRVRMKSSGPGPSSLSTCSSISPRVSSALRSLRKGFRLATSEGSGDAVCGIVRL